MRSLAVRSTRHRARGSAGTSARFAGFTRMPLDRALANRYHLVTNCREETVLTGQGDEIAVGQIRRHVQFGSEALYRICSCDGSYVQVEVIDAPGLQPGQHFKFLRSAVAAMELVAGHETAAEATLEPVVTTLRPA